MTTLSQRAAENLRALAANSYPGRGIVLGRSADGAAWVQLYWIMGRSANSRNRRFVVEGHRLRTEPLDAARMENPELVIYTAMDELDGHHVVTNGDHTGTVLQALLAGKDYRAALRTRSHEPDPPHNTPRIAGGIRAPEGDVWLAIVKADPAHAASTQAAAPGRSLRAYYEFEALVPGLGWYVSTYAGDGDPLPTFHGEPLALPLEGPPESLLAAFWEHLNADNRVALALKTIDAASGKARLRVMNARERME